MTKVKRLRTGLTVGVLVGGLVFLGWTKTRGVDATDCDTAFQNYINADQFGMFSMALDTCSPYTLDGCAQARAMADNCLVQYNWNNYSDPEEAMAVASQYMACREASKVDTCQ